MSQHYLFYDTPGHVPGVAGGPYAWCRVDVAEDGTITQTPLALMQAPSLSGEAIPITEQGAEFAPDPAPPEAEAVPKRARKGV